MKWHLIILFSAMMVFMINGTEAGWWNNSFSYYYNITLNDTVRVPRVMDIASYCINHSARGMALPYNDSIRILDGNTNNVNYVVYNITYVNNKMSYYCVDLIYNKTANVNLPINFSVYYSQNSQSNDNFIGAPTTENVTFSATAHGLMVNNNIFSLGLYYAGTEKSFNRTGLSTNIISQMIWKNITNIEHFVSSDDLGVVNCLLSNNTLYAIFECRNSILNYNLTYKIPMLTDYYYIEINNQSDGLTTMHTSRANYPFAVPSIKYGNVTTNYTTATNDVPIITWSIDWFVYPNSTSGNLGWWNIWNLSTSRNSTENSFNLFRIDYQGQEQAGFPHLNTSFPLISGGRLYRGYSDLGGIWEQQMRNLTIQFNQPITVFIGLQQDNSGEIIIASPNGTVSSVTVPYSVNFSAAGGINTCSYNVTTSAYVVKVSPTSVNCNNFSITSGTFIVPTDGDYIFFASGIKVTDSELLSQQASFTVSTSSGGTPGGGGGGGGGSTLFTIGASCTQDIECSSGICDTASKKCVTTLCGNNICDPNESQNSCQQDCSLANLNANELFNNPFFLGVLVIMVISVFILIAKNEDKNQKKRQRRV